MRYLDERADGSPAAQTHASQVWDQPIRFEEIFRAVVAQEIREGRMTSERRRRIVQYAAGMGLSAVQAGRLIEQCRNEALTDGDPEIRDHALRLHEPPPTCVPLRAKIALAAGSALVLHSVLRWMG